MMFWTKKKADNLPDYYQDYLHNIDQLGFSDDLISLDMETTGLNPKTAEVLSFGSVPVRNRKIVASEETHLFFGTANDNNEGVVFHELFSHTSPDVFLDFLPEIFRIISNHTILGHFVEFDVAIINRYLKTAGLPKLKNPIVDTLKLALSHDGVKHYQYANKEAYTLYALCQRFQIDINHTHDALEDAFLTGMLYLHLK